jgi:O-antigen ligase
VGELRIFGAFRRVLAVEPSVIVIVAGLALALYLQGAYYGPTQLVVGLVLFGGVFLLPRAPTFTREDLPVALCAAGLIGWALADGVLTHAPAGGGRYALLIAGVLLFAGTCRQLRGRARHDLLSGLIMICCLLAALGWVGVVGHHPPWGFESPGLWRASSTLTYPNATAALLAVVALVCLAVRTRDPGARWLGVAATALTTGLAATLSRAGVLGFGVGVVVLVVSIGWRPVARAALAPMAGAAIAMAGLLPSITADAPTPATIGLAAAGALAGLGVGSRTPASPFLLLVPAAAIAVVILTPHAEDLGSRFTFDSPDRWESIQTAWQVFTHHPLTGAGPGLDRLVLEHTQGGTDIFQYAHNEYLQVLAELGAIGGVLLAAFLFVVIRSVHRSRSSTGALAAGVLAGIAALVVHAGFDFVWHVPAIPLFAAALIGLAAPEHPTGPHLTTTRSLNRETERNNI